MPHAVDRRVDVRIAALAVAAAGLIGAIDAHAAAWTPEKGGGTVAVGYQYTHMQNHLDPNGDKIDIGSMDSRSVFVHMNYGITDRIAVNLYLPYVEKKYDGPATHVIQDIHGTTHVAEDDNGRYRGEFQDFSFGVQYQSGWGNWTVTPFAQYGYPSNDYPHFAHAAIGTNQKRFELGAQAARVLPAPFERVYVQFGYGYTWLEKFAHQDVSRSTLTIETGYFATDRLVLRAVVIGQKTHDGLDFPQDFPYRMTGSRTQGDIKQFSHHDQIQRVDFIEGVIGAAYLLSAETSIYSTVLSTIWGENSTDTDYAITVGLSRSF